MEKSKPLAIIVDVDGTLALMSDRSPYDWHRVKEDTVNEYVKRMVVLLSKDMKVIIFSGRDGVCYQDTYDWLIENNIPFDFLFMRPKGNFEKDSIIKERLYNEHVKGKYNIFAVFDDRLQVCDLWYSLGLPLFRVGDPQSNF